MKEMKCNAVQEEIVWGRPLSEEAQSHVLSCPSCNGVATEFSQLDSWVGQHLSDVEVPEGFADRVMARIDAQPVAMAQRLASRFEELLGYRLVQIALTYVGVLVTLVNLARFVFALLLPVKA